MSPRAERVSSPSLSGVFDRLLEDIVSGRYPAGAHLPAERDLARVLGASRPTLREALRRLGEWGLIEARRGSGVAVRDLRDWSIDVLPAYLRLGAPLDPPGAILQVVRDLLAVRRMVLLDVLRMVAPRTTPGCLDEARAAARRAWQVRHEPRAFQREDLELLRALLLSVRFLPALWMLNGLARVYLDLARTIGGVLVVPDDYLDAYETVCTALEAHDADAACAALDGYLANHDRRLFALLGETP